MKEGDDLSWEHRGGKERDESSGMWLMGSVIGGVVLLTAGIAFFFLKPSPPQAQTEAQVVTPVRVPAVLPTNLSENPPAAAAMPDILSFLKEVEPQAKAFLEAKSAAELLPLVRHPEITEPRIRATFPDGRIEVPGMESFARDRDAVFKEDSARVNVRTADFKDRLLTFVKAGSSWKIDWESWVGWSELSWEKLQADRPITPKRFRVKLVPQTYYNFGFTDELKWKSFGLLSPDGDHQLFGYVERGSELDRKIQLQDTPEGRDLLLDVKYPPGSTSKNQVIIDKVVAEGWLDPETDTR